MGEAIADREEEPDSHEILNAIKEGARDIRRANLRKLIGDVASLDFVLEPLEELEIEEAREGKPSWKQWWPFYGPFRAFIDACNGKPSIMGREGHFFRFYGSMLWHFGSSVGITFGTAVLADYFIGYPKN